MNKITFMLASTIAAEFFLPPELGMSGRLVFGTCVAFVAWTIYDLLDVRR